MATAKATQKTEEVPEAMDFGPEGWRPQPGDVVDGIITNITVGTSEYGSYPLVTVNDTAIGETAVHCFHSTIKRELQRMRPKVGHHLRIEYKGRKQTGGFGNKGYEVYSVTSNDHEFSWDAFGKAPEPQEDDRDAYDYRTGDD